MRCYQILGRVKDYQKTKMGFVFQLEREVVELFILTHDLIRVRMSRTGKFASDRSWAVIKEHWTPVSFEEDLQGDSLAVILPGLIIRINLDVFQISVYRKDSLINHNMELSFRDHAVRCSMDLPDDAKIYGCGEKIGFLNRRGRRLEMWTTDAVPHLPNTDPMYQSIPFFLMMTNKSVIGVFFDNSFRTFFDFGKEVQDKLSFWAEDGELNYYLFTGSDVESILRRYSELTGNMPMPPKWSLGLQQSRYSYYPEKHVREVAAEFRRRDIPCDVIYLDIHYMDGYRVFTWDPKRFPEPKRLLADLADEGFKPIPIIDPGVKIDQDYTVYQEGLAGDYFCRTRSGQYFKGEVWPGEVYFPDFLKASTRRWWGEHDADLIAEGAAGIWNDMNEPSNFLGAIDKDVIHGEDGKEISHGQAHNLYGLEMARATYEGLRRRFPDHRPFILTRSGYAGIQRYAAVWLGDNSSWWEHLAMAVPMLLNMSLSGVSYVGVDVGGFCDDCVPELFARWIAMGCFTPFFRIHSAIDTVDQEPWSFGTEVEEIARFYIKKRYELLPYIYDCFYEASFNGLPVMRPLWMEYLQDTRTHEIDDAYLFGPAFYVAPISRPGSDFRALYLPEGTWYDYWSDKIYEGPQFVVAEAPLSTIPLFVRGGSIIPSEPCMNYVGEKTPDRLIYDIYPATDSEYLHYEDDGSTNRYEAGEYCTTKVSCQKENSSLLIKIGKRIGDYQPQKRSLLLRIHSCQVEMVALDGRELVMVSSLKDLDGVEEGWVNCDNILAVRIMDSDTAKEVSVLGGRKGSS